MNIQSTAGYTTPSFTASPASGSLEGGADANTTGEEVYYYNVTYEPNSNVSGYGDEVMGTWAFTYDTLNRLAGSQGSQSGNSFTDYCWSYDQFGNRTQQLGATTAFPSGAGGPTICSTSQPQFTYSANNRILTSPTGAPVYDASGDITTGTDGNVYLYDAEGRICAVNRGGIMKGYVYDASGTRVAKGPITTMSCDPTTNGFETSGEESDYIHDQSGRPVTKTTMNSNGTMQWNYTNVYANGVLFATYDQQGLHFQLNDWLGTRRVTTDSAGVVEQTCASLPYGDQLNCSGSDDAPNEQHFTGKTHDDESGLDYFGARYYSSNDGRFLSPDPILQNALRIINPQRWNKYAYVINNPLVLTDPTGKDAAYVNFSGMALEFGHSGILSIHRNGSAEYSSRNGQGDVRTDTNLPTVQFNADGTPTDASYAALAKAVAGFESSKGNNVDPDSVGIVYYKTTSGETAALDQYIKNSTGKGWYCLIGHSCLDYAVGGLKAAQVPIWSQAKHFIIPNDLFLFLLDKPHSDSNVEEHVKRHKTLHCLMNRDGSCAQ